MRVKLKILLIFFLCQQGASTVLIAQDTSSSGQEQVDPENKKLFDNEMSFSQFIIDFLDIKASSNGERQKVDPVIRDSVFLALNEKKEVIIPKDLLHYFLEFSVEEQDIKPLVSKRVDVTPKDRMQRFSFDLNAGDRLMLEFMLSKGRGLGSHIEVLFNDVRWEQSLRLSRKTPFKFDQVFSQSGKLEIVIRNFGLFRIKGELNVSVKPSKEKIEFSSKRQPITLSKEVNSTVIDTLYKTLFDEDLHLNHQQNLTGNSTFERRFDFGGTEKLLGYAFYVNPQGENDKISYHRQVALREDPLEDFALKELRKRSFIYLEEHALSDLDISISDSYSRNFWFNGNNQDTGTRAIGLNAKSNYAFFRIIPPEMPYIFQIKITNRSMLYNRNLGLKIVALLVQSFQNVEEVFFEEWQEYIIIKLI